MPKRPPRTQTEIVVPPDLRGPCSPMTRAYANEWGEIWRADALEFLTAIADDTIDLVVTDPPYAIGKDHWDLFESLEAYVDWCDEWITHVERILKPSGSAYICGFSEILAEIKVRSSKRFAGGCRWLIWYYRNKANLGSDWGRSHESLLHLRKARRTKLNVDPIRIPYNNHTTKYPERTQATSSQYSGRQYSGSAKGARDKSDAGSHRWQPHPLGAKPRDVLEIPVLCNGTAEKTLHPTQKPAELIRRLIEGTSQEGELVVDPFVGSGTTAAVAQRYRRRFHVADADAGYVGVARERMVALSSS